MVRNLGIGAVPHGFRSRFRDRLEAAHRRSGLFEQRPALMEQWSAFLAE